MSKVKVLFCTDGIFPHAVGGMQRHSKLLVEKLAGNSHLELIVVHPHENISVFSNPSIREIALPSQKSSGKYLIDCYRYSKLVYETALRFPDAVIYSQGLSIWYGISNLGNRTIINPHGLESYQTLSSRDYLIGLPFRIIFSYLFRKSLRVVSLGGRLTTILEKLISPEKIVVLPNAVNVPDAINRSFTPTQTQFLFVGRFALNKGINILAETVKHLNEEGLANQIYFNLVGKGPLYEEYYTKYKYPNLNFLGFADDRQLTELYRTNDVFVLPTLFEGMPTVVLEAMSHGMPVIVTDVGATLEMVDSSNGWIIEKESVQSLSNAIHEYLALSLEERSNLSENSYLRVKNKFTWDIVSQKHAELFLEIANILR